MAEAPYVTTSISYHAWNKDGTQVAISPNTNEVWIYETGGKQDPTTWKKIHTLDEHGGQVSAIDWCHATNLLVTCGHDRNAYVWRFNDAENKWNPTLVILRINRAATHVKWSPNGDKFAVASGAKCVPVCHFEESNNWWISKMIKKHKSTVLSIAWCPNNKLIVTGSSDMKCRVFSAFMDGIDSAEPDGFDEVFSAKDEKDGSLLINKFGESLAEFDAKAWVHAVAWSPAGFRLAYASHGSTLSFVQLLAGSNPIVQTLNCKDLPYLDVQFLSDNSVAAAGFEANIDIFSVTGGTDAEPQWSFKDKVDKKEKKAAAAAPAATSGGFGAARAMFQSTVNQGTQFGAAPTASAITTKHQNTIVNIFVAPSADASLVTKFTTAGIDGRVLFWDVASFGLK